MHAVRIERPGRGGALHTVDTELLVLAERAGLRIHEVPVDWIDDPDSRVHPTSSTGTSRPAGDPVNLTARTVVGMTVYDLTVSK